MPTWREGQAIAASLVQDLQDCCERIEVGGSIRRRRPVVKDVELILIPRWGTREVTGQAAMFGTNVEPLNLTLERLEAMQSAGRLQVIKPGTHDVIPWALKPDGRYWRLWIPSSGTKVDVFVCNPDTWGLNLMIRTGSGVGPGGRPQDGFAPAMLKRWKEISHGGMAQGAMLRSPTGRVIPTAEEQDVFAAMRVRWVPPEGRSSARDVAAASLD